MTDTPRPYGTRPDPAQAQADHEKGRAIAARQAKAGQMAGTPDFDRGATMARQYAGPPNGGGEAHPRLTPSSDFEKGLAIGRQAAAGKATVAPPAPAAIVHPAPAGVAVASALATIAPAKAEAPATGIAPQASTLDAPLNASEIQMEAQQISEAFHRSFR